MILNFLLVLLAGNAFCNNCKPRVTKYGQVCVCNSSYCDSVPELGNILKGEFKVYSTSKSNLGFEYRAGKLSSKGESLSNITICIRDQSFQKILGFGGAFTDAVGINIKSLPKAAQNKLIQSYFGKDGIQYSLGRVPIALSDFSTHPYSYDDDHPGDVTLKYFKLQPEDFNYKIPYITEALNLRGKGNLKLISSLWSPPKWMKTYDVWDAYSMLKTEYYQLLADYMKRFFDEYEKNNITFWGTSTGNEPPDGFSRPGGVAIPALGWIPYLQMQWITKNLGPTLRNSHKDIKIIIHDDIRLTLPYFVPLMLHDPEALNYIDGVGVHWYADQSVSSEVLNLAKTDKKNITLLLTEACFFGKVELGNWERGAAYADSILTYLRYGFGGWMDWNLATDVNGGPSYTNNVVDSPIIVNKTGQEFYKQPTFYVMGHFSKFVIPGSLRLDTYQEAKSDNRVQSVGFLRPDNLKVVVIFNNGSSDVSIQIRDEYVYSEIIKIQAFSINTVLYNNY